MARIVLNGGSSSWKCGAYDVNAGDRAIDAAQPLAEVRLSWEFDSNDATIETRSTSGDVSTHYERVTRDRSVHAIFDALAKSGFEVASAESIGHRIVHGANVFHTTTWLDDDVIAKLRSLAAFAPEHNPLEIAAVEAVAEHIAGIRQYAVFDTQFHRTLPRSAYVYPGPYEWLQRDIRKYGFHGSSVGFATERVAALLQRPVEDANVIIAHLGNGCSVTAVAGGESVDTSMGFTPLDGTMMAQRSGAIDPAIAIFLMREAAIDETVTLRAFADGLDATLNQKSGLLGISGISSNLRKIQTAIARNDDRATLAIDLFVHRLAATIGSLLPALERLDALVFTGGIGEHDARIRAATCARLGIAGVHIDETANLASPVDLEISAPEASVRTFVIASREEWFIAREGARLSAVR